MGLDEHAITAALWSLWHILYLWLSHTHHATIGSALGVYMTSKSLVEVNKIPHSSEFILQASVLSRSLGPGDAIAQLPVLSVMFKVLSCALGSDNMLYVSESIQIVIVHCKTTSVQQI